MKAACPDCRDTHPSNDARAIGLFTGKVRYRADFDGAPVRATRALAEQDACDRRQARQQNA